MVTSLMELLPAPSADCAGARVNERLFRFKGPRKGQGKLEPYQPLFVALVAVVHCWLLLWGNNLFPSAVMTIGRGVPLGGTAEVKTARSSRTLLSNTRSNVAVRVLFPDKLKMLIASYLYSRDSPYTLGRRSRQ